MWTHRSLGLPHRPPDQVFAPFGLGLAPRGAPGYGRTRTGTPGRTGKRWRGPRPLPGAPPSSTSPAVGSGCIPCGTRSRTGALPSPAHSPCPAARAWGPLPRSGRLETTRTARCAFRWSPGPWPVYAPTTLTLRNATRTAAPPALRPPRMARRIQRAEGRAPRQRPPPTPGARWGRQRGTGACTGPPPADPGSPLMPRQRRRPAGRGPPPLRRPGRPRGGCGRTP